MRQKDKMYARLAGEHMQARAKIDRLTALVMQQASQIGILRAIIADMREDLEDGPGPGWPIGFQCFYKGAEIELVVEAGPGPSGVCTDIHGQQHPYDRITLNGVEIYAEAPGSEGDISILKGGE